MNTDRAIPVSVILRAVYHLLRFPFPTICRHSVASDLLSILEEHGTPIAEPLARAVVQADDETALELLKEHNSFMPDPVFTNPRYEYTTRQFATTVGDMGRTADQEMEREGWRRVWAEITMDGTFAAYRRPRKEQAHGER